MSGPDPTVPSRFSYLQKIIVVSVYVRRRIALLRICTFFHRPWSRRIVYLYIASS
jgi:hypothetical protein